MYYNAPLATVTDAIAQNVNLELSLKLRLLEQCDPGVRAEMLIAELSPGGDRSPGPIPFSEN